MKKLFFLFLLSNLQYAICDLAFSQWNANSAVNTPISVMLNDQQDEHIISDTKGGAIIVWEDFRSDTDNADVYIQRIDKNGYIKWTVNGINICANASDQGTVSIIEDGFGGAILSWNDHRNGDKDIYAQRIDSSGNALWQADGVPVCINSGIQSDSKLASDGNGGVIIVWQDSTNDTTRWDIYAQRISSAGAPMWVPSCGVPISTELKYQTRPRIRGDGMGGAIIVWQDKQNGNYDIYAKRVNNLGNTVWGGQFGSAVCTAPRGQLYPILEPDGTGGAIIAWADKRNIFPSTIDTIYDIYAQRVGASGNMQWPDGISVDTATGTQDILDMTPDGSGGAIIVWKDFRNGNDYDIYAQRVGSSGVLWTPNGTPIDISAYDQASPSITGDGAGGAIIAFRDSGGVSGDDISSVKINSSGVIQWKSSVGTASRKQDFPRSVSDGAGGCIYTFMDKRDTVDWDIYAHHLYWNGTENGINESAGLITSKCFPNPFSYSTMIEFDNPNFEKISFVVYDVLGMKIEVPFTVSQNKITVSKGGLQIGIYFYEIKTNNNAVSKGKFILTD